ncbi:hypothetical protein OYA92_11435, partial [Escherichia coli]|nr:hypothetical protein [Escherichia coli]
SAQIREILINESAWEEMTCLFAPSLTTQRPRDITEGVLSQIGTLLVHRLTNDRDREVVERACGEIDKSAASFLPSLKQGEVALVGVDFPIPMTIQIDKPIYPPESDSPGYCNIWKK